LRGSIDAVIEVAVMLVARTNVFDGLTRMTQIHIPLCTIGWL